jgi:chemotaxis family two-component system response regulator Rcp1
MPLERDINMPNSNHSPRRPAEILLVEDEPGDAYLTQEALKNSPIPCRVHLVEDGAQAMAFLRRFDPHTEAPRPDLILLDLNLPRKDGRQVLAEIKADPSLTTIPVVIMTTSKAEGDILSSYQLRANSFVTKPLELEQFIAAVRTIQEFWLAVAQLPPAQKNL